jgi:hypothetical protein
MITTASYYFPPAPPLPPNFTCDQSQFWSYASADFGSTVGTAEIYVPCDHVRSSHITIARTRMFQPDQQVSGISQSNYHQAQTPCLPLKLEIPKAIVLESELNTGHGQNKVIGTGLLLGGGTLHLPAYSTMYVLNCFNRSHGCTDKKSYRQASSSTSGLPTPPATQTTSRRALSQQARRRREREEAQQRATSPLTTVPISTPNNRSRAQQARRLRERQGHPSQISPLPRLDHRQSSHDHLPSPPSSPVLDYIHTSRSSTSSTIQQPVPRSVPLISPLLNRLRAHQTNDRTRSSNYPVQRPQAPSPEVQDGHDR